MFQVVNQKSIGAFNTIFGPSIKAVLTLSSKTAEMASILPTIIGASSDSRNVNFQDLVLKHLKNSTVEVPAQGYELKLVGSFHLMILLSVMLSLNGLRKIALTQILLE